MQRLGALLVALVLAACNQQPPNDKEVLQQGARLVKPLPGLYRSTTRLKGFDLPGAPPQTEDDMRDRFSQVLPQTREHCVTPEEAERGFEDMVRQSQSGDCTIERFVANRTELSARMRCQSGANLVSVVSVEGTGQPDRSHVDLTVVQSGPAIPGGSETITMAVDNQRLGDCPPQAGKSVPNP
jgi:hypothetical protein